MVQRRSHMRGLCRSPIFLALGRGLFFAALLTLGLLAFVGVLSCSTLWSLTGGLLLLTYADAVIHIGQNSFKSLAMSTGPEKCFFTSSAQVE
jgi:hypothetical protein